MITHWGNWDLRRVPVAASPARGGFSAPAILGELFSGQTSSTNSEINLDEIQQPRLTERWGKPALMEFQALRRETDAGLFYEALLGMAQRQERAGHLENAAELYAAVAGLRSAEGNATPVGAVRERPLRMRAERHLDAILGRGAFGPRAEFLLRNLAQQASDPTAILAMGAAGAVFRLTRVMTLSRLAALPNPGFLTQVLGAGRVASLAGFTLEAPTFTLVGRLGGEVLGRTQDWSGSPLARDFASSYLVLGGLKLTGWASGTAYRGVAGSVGAVRERPLQVLFQQGGMLSGIFLGHALEQWTGLRPAQDGATTLTDSLATLLQFNIAGRLARHAFGPRFAAWERNLDQQAAALEVQRPRIPPIAPGLSPILQAAGPAGTPGNFSRPEIPAPAIWMMSGQNQGGGRGRGLPAEANYWLFQVGHENPAQAIAAVVRLQDLLLSGEGLNPRQHVALFRQLYRKTDTNLHADAYEMIIEGLNETLSRMPADRPGPRALFREMLQPKHVEDYIVPGFLAAWLKNPSLNLEAREQIVDRVSGLFRRGDFKLDVVHNQALTLISEVFYLSHLEPHLFQRLVREAIRFAEYNPPLFNEFEQSLDLARELLGDGRVSASLQRNLLNVLRSGVSDAGLRSQRRVEILDNLEDLAIAKTTSGPARNWLERHLPRLREHFLERNLAEIRRDRRQFQNFAEVGYLLTRDYLSEDMKVILAQDLVNAFCSYPTSSKGYDHLAHTALVHVFHPNLPWEARFQLWTILLKAAYDQPTFSAPLRDAGRRTERLEVQVANALARMPREERRMLLERWSDRMQRGLPDSRIFAAQILESLYPYLEPSFDLRAKLEAAARNNLPEVRDTVDRVLSHWNRLN